MIITLLRLNRVKVSDLGQDYDLDLLLVSI
jgi:hypothetical protein